MSSIPSKRRPSTTFTQEEPAKRHKTNSSTSPNTPPLAPPHIDHLTKLSDELLIRILSLLPLETILLIQQLSHRYQTLARDNQVWKGLYYTRFVLPRSIREAKLSINKEDRGERLDKIEARRKGWLMQEKLLEWEKAAARHGPSRTDWKARYRLNLNWSRGKAEVREVGLGVGEVDDVVDKKPQKLVIRLVDGVVVTAAADTGLCAWDVKSKSIVDELSIARCDLDAVPTSIGVDTADGNLGARIVVGFADGSFGVWMLNRTRAISCFEQLFTSPAMTIGEQNPVMAVAYSHPYILNISSDQTLTVYDCSEQKVANSGIGNTTPAPDATVDSNILCPKRLAALQSHTSWPPLTLSIRSTPDFIIASVAYSIPTYISGWTVGLQELHISSTSGNIIQSRLASAIDTGFQSLLSNTPTSSGTITPQSPGQTDGRGTGSVQTVPSSLSYSHPYLLAGHKDNTLTLYMVRSDAEQLKISKGTRLWGHTSSISGASIGGRGKAVSVGGGSGEVRVWELEGGRQIRGAQHGGSIKISGDVKLEAHISTPGSDYVDGGDRNGWVGFDDEVVVVMKNGVGQDALIVYDFT